MAEGEEDPMQAGELIPIHTQHTTACTQQLMLW